MNNNVFDVLIIGAGHAGLGLSYHLKRFGLKHLVLERGCIGESWRNQRWNSFRLNTTNKFNQLPGEFGGPEDADSFITAVEFADYLHKYVSRYDLPVVENSVVRLVSKDVDTGIFKILTDQKHGQQKYYARQVVVASGAQNQMRIPGFAEGLSQHILQLHSSEFKSSSRLPAGAVLIVGSAQSGCQIAEDLALSGRKVYLSTSMVPRLPRKYRGKDIIEWLVAFGFFDVLPADVKDPKVFQSTAPQLTGTTGATISLQSLSENEVTILGRLAATHGTVVELEANAAEHVKFADEFSINLKKKIDEFINQNEIVAPAADLDLEDLPDTDASCASNITSLDLAAYDIRTVIWATGFLKDLNFLKPLEAVNTANPAHVNGISNIDGLYFIGLPWLRKRKSGLIHGIIEDAEFIAEQVFNRWKFFRIRKEVMNYD